MAQMQSYLNEATQQRDTSSFDTQSATASTGSETQTKGRSVFGSRNSVEQPYSLAELGLRFDA